MGSSRQLGARDHEMAAKVPSEIITLYLRRCSNEAGGPFGLWRCMIAFQGTMPAASWPAREINIGRGSLSICMSRDSQIDYRWEVDESGGTIDILHDADNEHGNVSRGVYQLEANSQVMVATRNEHRGGVRPTGPPEGLPSVEVQHPHDREPVTSVSPCGCELRC